MMTGPSTNQNHQTSHLNPTPIPPLVQTPAERRARIERRADDRRAQNRRSFDRRQEERREFVTTESLLTDEELTELEKKQNTEVYLALSLIEELKRKRKNQIFFFVKLVILYSLGFVLFSRIDIELLTTTIVLLSQWGPQEVTTWSLLFSFGMSVFCISRLGT